MNKKRIRFIINPASGIGKHKNIVKYVEQYLDKSQFHYEIVFTEKQGHGISLSKQAAENGYFAVVAVGGDGSINEVASSLIGSDTALAIIPTGSGNGFANHFHIPHDMKMALNVINTGKVISIDTMNADSKTVIGICGVGFDAHIAHEFAMYGKRGFSSYIKVVLREFPRYKNQNYKMMINGSVIEHKALLITFANASQFGNNAVINPQANVQDGIMEICILKPFKFWQFPKLAYALFHNKIHLLPFVEVIKADQVSLIKYDKKIAHIDGEPVFLEEETLFSIKPNSLKIITPV
jgi:diacylglycerol kinase (ATP)